MPSTGKDCCATCPFNGLNNGKRVSSRKRQFVCQVRNFVIQDPIATYCNNHPLRNPLWLTTPRGPIWASVHLSFDSKPLDDGILIPSELVPPQAQGEVFRIPYFRLVRPLEGEPGVCSECGEAARRSIILLLEQEKRFFCCAAHYFQWWLRTDPQAITHCVRTPLDHDAIRKRLQAVPEKLSNGLSVLADGDAEWVMDALQEVDDLLQEIRNSRNELMYAAINQDQQEFDHPQFYETLSPYLLQIQSGLTVAGDLFRKKDLDYTAIMTSVTNIGKAVSSYLRREWRH